MVGEVDISQTSFLSEFEITDTSLHLISVNLATTSCEYRVHIPPSYGKNPQLFYQYAGKYHYDYHQWHQSATIADPIDYELICNMRVSSFQLISYLFF